MKLKLDTFVLEELQVHLTHEIIGEEMGFYMVQKSEMMGIIIQMMDVQVIDHLMK